jgi:alkaline phosphatase
MPYIALSDTSAANNWVTDSAAGMTAIVTGRKTNSGVVSQSPAGEVFKTILEYAEERGLSTGVVSNMNIADATPAACYSHSESRKNFADIFSQIWKPRFGDGVDLVLGAGKTRIADALRGVNIDFEQQLRASGRPIYPSIAEIPADAKKAVALFESGDDVKVDEATAKAIQILSRNPKGYFLMVEWDLHPTRPEKALETVVAFDRLIEKTAKGMASKDTLVLFTADHSFDFRLVRGKRGTPLAQPASAKESAAGKFDINLGTSHTGEEVLVAAHGPGAQRVKGFMANTELFKVMLAAYGWAAK